MAVHQYCLQGVNLKPLNIFLLYENIKLQIEQSKPIQIGRDINCDLKISSQSVSRHHCSINFTSEQFLEIIDTSTNGTRVFTSKGELLYLKDKKHTFRKLSEVYPLTLLLADEIEVTFEYVNLKTKTIQKRSKPIPIIIKKPNELNLENIELIAKILPSAAMAMLRKLIELKLKQILVIKEKKTLQYLIKQCENENRFTHEIIAKLKDIQYLGNKSLHEEQEISLKTVEEFIQITKNIFKVFQDKSK